MAKTLLDKLREKRPDYDEERTWHRFLLDAYAGTGGFAGRVKPPDHGYLGWAAEVYSSTLTNPLVRGARDTYLDRFPREDQPKFERRQDVAHYVNYVAPICDLFSSYLASESVARDGVDGLADLAQWMQDADGCGTPWDELKADTIVPRALQLGWCPVMLDRDPAPVNVTLSSKAQERELRMRTRAIPLFPANLVDWEVDDAGALLWAKVLITYKTRLDPLGEHDKYDKVLIWTRTDVSEYRIVTTSTGKEDALVVREHSPHGFGGVPIVVFRAGKSPDDPVRGVSCVGAVAVENRRHFNVLSELDEHLRSTVFALLQVPVPPGAKPPEELLAGSGNAVPVPSDASQGYEFVAPPVSVAETYEVRLSESAREIHRIASAPFDNDSGAAQSGVSRAYQFEGTNKRLVKIAAGLASAEQRALQMVAASQGAGPDDVNAIRCSAPAEFRVDDLSVDLDNLIKAVSIKGMSATAKMLMQLRTVQKMLPNMHADQRKLIEAEMVAARDAELAGDEAAEPDDSADDATDGNAADDEPDDESQAAA